MSKSKKWIIKGEGAPISRSAELISQELGFEYTTAKILAVKGYDTPEKVREYISKENTLMYNPFLLTDMDKAVKRIFLAVENGEKTVVYGDYDVDGVSATSVLYLYLKSIGANVGYYIPSRAGEGYGMNTAALDKLKAEGYSLVVTVDTGVTAALEAEYLKSIGMSLIVTDHHSCHDTLPDCCAVVNPRRQDDAYPFKELAGVGVVFKLVTALEFTLQEKKVFGGSDGLDIDSRFTRLIESGKSDFLEKVIGEYADLVTLGTISDVMLLTDENRLICSYGLAFIENAPRVGVLALMDYADGLKNRKYPKKRKVTASYISFTVAPRINAAGRIAHAAVGVELFTTSDKDRAAEIAAQLCDFNLRRQAEENKISLEAMELAEKTHDFENDPVLVLSSESWHHGIIGIVASRLTERYGVPTILISVEDGVGKGSGRSVKGLNLSDALSACADTLIRYGGHELAAGLTLDADKIEQFRKAINDYARASMTGEGAEQTVEIDAEVTSEEITLKLAEEISYMEPFGVGNSQPMLLLRNATVQTADSIGDGKHCKFTVDGKTALLFGVSLEEADICEGDTVDAVFRIDINEFRGIKTEQMQIIDARIKGAYDDCMGEAELLNDIENGRQFAEDDGILPTRDDFAAIYREVRAFGEQGRTVSMYRLLRELAGNGISVRGAKLKLALEILSDVGLISFKVLAGAALSGAELYSISYSKTTEKVNLFGTPRYKSIKSLMIRN